MKQVTHPSHAYRLVILDWCLMGIMVCIFFSLCSAIGIEKTYAPDCSQCHSQDAHNTKKNVKWFGKRWLR